MFDKLFVLIGATKLFVIVFGSSSVWQPCFMNVSMFVTQPFCCSRADFPHLMVRSCLRITYVCVCVGWLNVCVLCFVLTHVYVYVLIARTCLRNVCVSNVYNSSVVCSVFLCIVDFVIIVT
jgi:hypothetical protein